MSKKIYFFILFIFLNFNALAQSGSIKGKVVASDGKPVANANISLENTQLGGVTTEQGNFEIKNIPIGNYILVVSGVGLQTQKQDVNISEGRALELNLKVIESNDSLEEISIYGQRNYLETVSSIGSRSNIPLMDLPQSAQLVNRQILNEQTAYRLTDALRNVAGVTEGYWNLMNFRGFETNVDQVLVNGQRGILTNEDYSPTLANIERVEVIRGPAGALYGNGALGGTINMVTKQPLKNRQFEFTQTFGSFNTFRTQADATGALNTKKNLAYRLVVGYENAGRFTRDWKQENLLIAPSLLWEISPKTSLNFNGVYYWDKRTNNYDVGVPLFQDDIFRADYRFNANQKDSEFKANNFQIQLNFKHQFSDNWSINLLSNYAQQNTNSFIYAYYDAPANNGDLTLYRQVFSGDIPIIANNLFVTGKFNTGKIKHNLTLGLDQWLNNGQYPDGFSYFPVNEPLNIFNPTYGNITVGDPRDFYFSSFEQYKTQTQSAYIQDQISFLDDKLKALIGLRYEKFQFDYLAKFDPGDEDVIDGNKAEVFVPRFGLVYQPINSLSIYGSYSQGFVPPRFAQRAVGGPFPPIRGNQLEFGLKSDLIKDRLNGTLAVYQIIQTNVVTPIPNSPLREPTGEVRSRGIELSLTGNITKGLNVIVNYALNETITTKSNNESQIGKRFVNAPAHNANFWATYNFSENVLKGLKLGLGFRAMSERTTSLGDTPNLPGFGVVDAIIGYQIKGFSLNLNLNSLTDKRYFIGSLSNATGYYGMPRSFLLTLGYKF
jgi:iron complex outermembrane receptor protein